MSKYIIFSFDDGRKDQYDVAYKLLKKYGFPATINIVSEFVNNEKQFECFKTAGNESLTWEELKEMAQDGGWEIACHGATHKNTVADIKDWLNDNHVIENGWDKNVGFASPGSLLMKDNCKDIEQLVINGELMYIRSGKQTKREGLLYALKAVLNRKIKSKKLFCNMNKDCILNIESNGILKSIGITSYNSVEEIIGLFERLRDGEAVILMFHSILYREKCQAKDCWFWEAEKLVELCDYIKGREDLKVVTTKEWWYMRNVRN